MESPFAGLPRTTVLYDEAGAIRGFKVHIRALTPEGVKAADALGMLSLIAGLIFVLTIGSAAVSAAGTAMMALAWLIIGWPLCKGFWRAALEKQVRCAFSPEHFTVRDGWTRRVYDRTKAHRFRLALHDKADKERREHEAQLRRGQTSNPEPIYSDSFHVVFEYFGVRRDVVTVYERPRAEAIFERLNQCNNFMNQRTGRSGGTPLGPGDEWPDGPGDLPAGRHWGTFTPTDGGTRNEK